MLLPIDISCEELRATAARPWQLSHLRNGQLPRFARCSYANCIIDLFLCYFSRMQLVTALVNLVKITFILFPRKCSPAAEHDEISAGKCVS